MVGVAREWRESGCLTTNDLQQKLHPNSAHLHPISSTDENMQKYQFSSVWRKGTTKVTF